MEIIKTELGTFARVKKGIVCFRDESGNFTDKKIDLYAEIPIEDTDATGMTRHERAVTDDAVKHIFAPLFRESNAFKIYIEKCKELGLTV